MQSRGFINVQAAVLGLILAIVASTFALAFARAQVTAADQQRLTDISRIEAALKLFFDTNGFYPQSNGTSEPQGMSVYLDYWPKAPTKGCGQLYNYSLRSSGQEFSLSFCLDESHDNLRPGNHVLTSRGIQ